MEGRNSRGTQRCDSCRCVVVVGCGVSHPLEPCHLLPPEPCPSLPGSKPICKLQNHRCGFCSCVRSRGFPHIHLAICCHPQNCPGGERCPSAGLGRDGLVDGPQEGRHSAGAVLRALLAEADPEQPSQSCGQLLPGCWRFHGAPVKTS